MGISPLKLKVLHVFKTSWPDSYGGVEQTIRQLAKSHVISGQYDVKVISLADERNPQNITYDGVEHIRYKQDFQIASTGFSWGLAKSYRNAVAWADVIHYHFPWPFADLLHVCWQIKKPTVLTYHSDIVKQKKLLWFYKPLMNMFLKRMNAIVATSPNYLYTSKTLQAYKNKVSLIAIGLDQSDYPLPSDYHLNFWRAKVGENFFLFVGILRYYKGLHILLEAIKETTLRVVIVGSGPIEEELKSKAKKLNLTNIIFLGYVEECDKCALLTLAKAIVFPSLLRSEAFGCSLLEGAIFSKPLISCEIGSGTSFINQNNETGFVTPPADPLALRRGMLALNQDNELAKRFGANARKRYENLFQASSMAQAYSKLYRQIYLKTSSLTNLELEGNKIE